MRMRATKAVSTMSTVPRAQLPLHKQSGNDPGSFSLKASVRSYRNGGALAALQAGRSHRNDRVTLTVSEDNKYFNTEEHHESHARKPRNDLAVSGPSSERSVQQHLVRQWGKRE